MVSLAGPATNFRAHDRSAVVAQRLYHPAFNTSFVIIADLPIGVPDRDLLRGAVNLFLGVFNFLPIPPLDGASAARARDAEPLASGLGSKFRPYGIPGAGSPSSSGGHLPDRLFSPFLQRLYDFILR